MIIGRNTTDSASRKRFYAVAEAARLLGLSEPTLYRAIRGGQFPAIRVRGRYVVPAAAIDQMEAEALALGGVDSIGSVSGRTA
ncbi:hypothetical protein GCM10010201_13400 [Pilimelia columellifera subsp. columellifera]|uniref:Helix-turn-helix domain-containing protein n=1 Tax=Pilimelia columellifera subsp. columellifera TaxID=706583 RepID=A0ABN3NAU0_9ACTN